MLLYKIEDFNPNYREAAFNGEDIKGLDIYAGNTVDIHPVLKERGFPIITD